MNTKTGTVLSILIVITSVTGLSVAEVAGSTETGFCGPHTMMSLLDFTEGGHLETDFGANMIAEWWYLNGKLSLVADDGDEVNDLGFFAVLAHEESPLFADPNGKQLSHLLTFSGLFPDRETPTFYYTETYVPQVTVSHFVSLHTPYVYFGYPGGLQRFCGAALTGYRLNYKSDVMDADLVFWPVAEKTIDQADQPLNFITHEHSYGTLGGSIVLNGKTYQVKYGGGEGYMDHMIPSSSMAWPMDMHGWSWSEVTAGDYQAVVYAVRSLTDGYENYSYKHLTLLNVNKNSGKVIAEYSGDEITIIESDWINETEFNRSRPGTVTYSTPDWNVTVNAENVAYFNQTRPGYVGFVDFAAFQPCNATIEHRSGGAVRKGSAFNEYLVTDLGVQQSSV